MKYNYLLLFICFAITACSTTHYFISLPAQVQAKSYTIWYSDENTTLPLLGGLEQSPSSHSAEAGEVKLGLVLLQGKRFAQCNYVDNDVTCILDLGIQSSKMQKIALDIAYIIAHQIQTSNPLPLYWEKTQSKDNKYFFTNTKNKRQIQVEENYE